MRPATAGTPIHVAADYDPRSYALRQDRRRVGDVDVLTVQLRPTGSELMALLRAKLGGRPAMLRIALPRDVRLEIGGRLVRTFAAMELGGLSVAATDHSCRASPRGCGQPFPQDGETDVALDEVTLAPAVMVENTRAAGGGLEKSQKQPDGGRFLGAVGTQETEDLTSIDLEIQSPDPDARTVVPAESSSWEDGHVHTAPWARRFAGLVILES